MQYKYMYINILYLCKKYNIMNLDWLSPVDNKNLGAINKNFFTFYNDSSSEIEEVSNFKVLFITKEFDFCNNVRKSIEKFQNHFNNIVLYDGGYYLSDSIHGINTNIQDLIANNVIPIIIGYSPQEVLDFANDQNLPIFLVTNKLGDVDTNAPVNRVNYLGYQRHLSPLDTIHAIEESSFNSMSLGKMRSAPNLLEPTLRDTSLLSIELNAIRSSDAPCVMDALPSGLNAEELCQLAKYAGMTNLLKAVFIEANNGDKLGRNEADLIAEAIWYLLEGINMSINDHPKDNKDYSEFVVYSNYFDQDLAFLRNNQSLKWWLKIESGDADPQYLACSYEEYQQCISDELPDRILKFMHEH